MNHREDEPSPAWDQPTRELADHERAGTGFLPGPGDTFAGRYEILERIGAGGSGEVFRAWDAAAQAEVALKILTEPGSQRSLERLRRELRLVRELTHPGIVRVHDLGSHDGRLFTVAELLRGESLAERIARRGPLPADEAQRVLRGVLEALAAAHAAGIVHRDVKPANIFLTRHGAESRERVVLLDFGLARQRDDPALTDTGRFLGTPYYAAPEQALGQDDPTPATDLYAVGAVLWEMFAGKPPFSEGSQIEILRAHMETPPPRPGRALAAAPWHLRSFAVQLLEKEPARRPRDAREALARLEGSRWWGFPSAAVRRALRRPGRAVRIAATGLGLTAAAAFGAAWLLAPVEVSGDGRDLVWTTRVGTQVRTGPFPGPVNDAAIDRTSSRLLPRALVATDPSASIGTRRGGPSMPLLSAVRFPFAEPPGTVLHFTDGRRGENYSGLSEPMRPLEVIPLSHLSRQGEASSALLMVQPPGWASALWVRVPYEGGVRVAEVWHPGYLVTIEALRPAPEDTLTLVASAFNNWAGPRAAVLGIPANVQAQGQAPPYVGSLRDFKPAGGWYTFLPALRGADDSSLQKGDGGLQVLLSGLDEPIPLDPSTGTPLRSKHRHGLPRRTWEQRRGALMDGLFEAARLRQGGEAERAANRLESYARARPRDPIMASVAAYRAALAHQESAANVDDLDAYRRALAAAELALELDPEPSRVRLLAAELAARTDRAETAGRLVRQAAGLEPLVMYCYEWMLANELAGRPVPLTTLHSAWTSGLQNFWQALMQLFFAAHGAPEVEPEAALGMVERLPPKNCWDVHRYWGARLLLDGPRPDPQRALEWIRRAADARTAGWYLPVELITLRIRHELGESIPDHRAREAAAREIGRLEKLARTELHALLMLREARGDLAAITGRDRR